MTLDGTVECDASIMDGLSRDVGAVGAVSGVKNPIKAAHAVLLNSRNRDRLGRIPPLCVLHLVSGSLPTNVSAIATI